MTDRLEISGNQIKASIEGEVKAVREEYDQLNLRDKSSFEGPPYLIFFTRDSDRDKLYRRNLRTGVEDVYLQDTGPIADISVDIGNDRLFTRADDEEELDMYEYSSKTLLARTTANFVTHSFLDKDNLVVYWHNVSRIPGGDLVQAAYGDFPTSTLIDREDLDRVQLQVDLVTDEYFMSQQNTGIVKLSGGVLTTLVDAATYGANIKGIAYDPVLKQIYYWNGTTISRIDADGSNHIDTGIEIDHPHVYIDLDRFLWFSGYNGNVGTYIMKAPSGTVSKVFNESIVGLPSTSGPQHFAFDVHRL